MLNIHWDLLLTNQGTSDYHHSMPYRSKLLSFLLSPIFEMLYQQTLRMLLPGNSLKSSLKEKFLIITMTKSATRTPVARIAGSTWGQTKAKDSKSWILTVYLTRLFSFLLGCFPPSPFFHCFLHSLSSWPYFTLLACLACPVLSSPLPLPICTCPFVVTFLTLYLHLPVEEK